MGQSIHGVMIGWFYWKDIKSWSWSLVGKGSGCMWTRMAYPVPNTFLSPSLCWPSWMCARTKITCLFSSTFLFPCLCLYPSSHTSVPLETMGWSIYFCSCTHDNVVFHHNQETRNPRDHGLKSLILWTKVKFASFKLFFYDIFHSQEVDLLETHESWMLEIDQQLSVCCSCRGPKFSFQHSCQIV